MAEQFCFVEAELSGAQRIPAQERELRLGLHPLQPAGGKLANAPIRDRIGGDIDRGTDPDRLTLVGAHLVKSAEHAHCRSKGTDELIYRFSPSRSSRSAVSSATRRMRACMA